jgi:hypothetical protein
MTLWGSLRSTLLFWGGAVRFYDLGLRALGLGPRGPRCGRRVDTALKVAFPTLLATFTFLTYTTTAFTP